MNYYTYSLIMGLFSVIIYYIYNYKQGNILEKKKYIQFFIISTIFSVISIYGYISINKLNKLNIRNNLTILTGEPNF
jgi:FtsH-binding integral membrane protein